MNHIIKRTIRRAGEQLIEQLVETPHNGPCHGFLPASGFVRTGARFVLATDEVDPDPAWLTVEPLAAAG